MSPVCGNRLQGGCRLLDLFKHGSLKAAKMRALELMQLAYRQCCESLAPNIGRQRVRLDITGFDLAGWSLRILVRR